MNAISFDQRQKVGDGTMDLVILGVVAVGGYLAYKAISGMFGPNKAEITAANNKTVDQNTQNANAATQQQIQATGQQPTLSPQLINSAANTISSVITGTDPSDFPLDISAGSLTVNNAVVSIGNYSDWVALVAQFGTKQLLNGQSVDLVTALSLALDAGTKSGINGYMIAQGIVNPSTRMYVEIP